MRILDESLDSAKINKSIANERLKMDYRRLKNAGIAVEMQYFQSVMGLVKR